MSHSQKISESQSFKARCCNPSNKINHESKSKDLRRISSNLQKKFPSIPSDSKVCGSCSKEAIACFVENPSSYV